MNGRETKEGNSLNRQLLFHAVIPAVFWMCLVGFVLLSLVSEEMTGFLKREAQEHSRLVCERLDRHFEKYMQLVSQGKYNRELQNYLKEVEREEQAYTNRNFEYVWKIMNALLETEEDTALRGTTWIADINANILLEDSASGRLLTRGDGWNFTDRPWARTAFFEEEVFLTDPYQTKTEGTTVISVICPVRDWETRQLLGVFGADVPLSNLEKIIKSIGFEFKDKIILINKDRQILYHEDKAQLLKSYEKKEAASVIRKTEKTDWKVISEIPMERLRMAIREIIRPLGFLFLLSIFLEIAYATVILQRNVINPLKKVEAAAIDISQGKLDFELKLDSAQEIEQIARILNEDVKGLCCELREKERHIIESMEYAGLLQERIMKAPFVNGQVWFESGYVLRPLELVGGDFLWGTAVENGFLLVLGDCTGHGVPGALLSVVAVSILRGILEGMKKPQLDLLLWKFDQMLYESLNVKWKAEDFDIAAGVDMGLLLIREDKSFSFAGANQQLYLEKNEIVEIVKGDRLTVGEGKSVGPESFTVFNFERQEGISGYLATDGFFDQPGGDRRLPFGYNRMKRILIKYREKTIDEIIGLLLKELEDYKDKETQRDDIGIFGFRL